jgi:acyl-CoA synthetase (AMP-forming)/AMP-acid ligase II
LISGIVQLAHLESTGFDQSLSLIRTLSVFQSLFSVFRFVSLSLFLSLHRGDEISFFFLSNDASQRSPAFPIAEVAVIDPETHRRLGVMEEGELVVKSVLIMKVSLFGCVCFSRVQVMIVFQEYWNKPDATHKAIIAIDGDSGWFRTGDMAKVP